MAELTDIVARVDASDPRAVAIAAEAVIAMCRNTLAAEGPPPTDGALMLCIAGFAVGALMELETYRRNVSAGIMRPGAK